MKTSFDNLIQNLLQKAMTDKIPMNGSFELTSRCNLNCRMCYIHNRNNACTAASTELSADQWIKLASEARDAGMLSLVLTGGEIFLRQDFKTIYEKIAKMGFQVILYTNGTLIDENTAKWLGKIPPATIEITLYGASPETYDKVCGNAQAFLDVINAIDYLLAEGVNVKLKTTVTRNNKEDYPALMEFANKRHLPLDIVDYLIPARSAANTASSNRLSPAELLDYRLSIQGNGSTKSEMAQIDLDLINDLNVNVQKEIFAFSCNAGSCNFWITWDGRMTPCGFLEELAALPLKVGLDSAWSDICDLCKEVPVCEECKTCNARPFCEVCPAKLKAETGFYDQPADYLCKFAKLAQQKFLKQSI